MEPAALAARALRGSGHGVRTATGAQRSLREPPARPSSAGLREPPPAGKGPGLALRRAARLARRLAVPDGVPAPQRPGRGEAARRARGGGGPEAEGSDRRLRGPHTQHFGVSETRRRKNSGRVR